MKNCCIYIFTQGCMKMKTYVFISVYNIDEVNKKYNHFSKQEKFDY